MAAKSFVFKFRWSPDGHYIAALSFAEPPKLMLYDVKTHEQRVVFAPKGGAAGWPAWSRDSRFVYVDESFGEEYRVQIKDRKADRVADLKLSFAPTEPNFGWVGLGPDGSLLATRNAGTNTEIYALDWDEH